MEPTLSTTAAAPPGPPDPTPTSAPATAITAAIKGSWRSTIIGLFQLAAAGWVIYHDPTQITSPAVMALVAGGTHGVIGQDGGQ